MFDLSPAVLFSGMFIATVGFGLFIYGKKQEDFLALGAGIVLSVVPFIFTTLLGLWLITAAIVGGMWAQRHYAG